MSITADALAAIESPVTQVTRRAELYESDASTPFLDDIPLEVSSGQVSAGYDRDVRRTLTVNFHDEYQNPVTNEWVSIPIGPTGIWYDKVIKVYRGVEWVDSAGDTQSWEQQLGQFRIDNVRQAHHPKGVVTINGRDDTKLALLTKFGTSLSFPAGTNVADLLSTIASNAGLTKQKIAPVQDALDDEVEFSGNDTRWQAIKEIAEAFALETFMDREGYFTVRRFRDPAKTAPSHIFAVADNLTSYEKTMNDSNIYNHVVVVGKEADELPVFGEASNTAGGSPTNIATLGERTLRIETELVQNAVDAEQLALSYLAASALEAYEINWGSIVYPHLDVGEVVEFEDPYATTIQPTRFLLTDITIPLSLGPMTANGKRLQVLT